MSPAIVLLDEAYDSDYDDEPRPMPSSPEALAAAVQVLRDKACYARYGPAALNRILQNTNSMLGGTVCKCRACFRSKRFDPDYMQPEDLALPPSPCILKLCLIDQCARLGLTCNEFNEDLSDRAEPEDAEDDAHLLLVTEDGQWDVWYADRFPHSPEGFQRHEALPSVKALFAACHNPAQFFRHSDGTDYMALAAARDSVPAPPRATHGDMIILHDSSDEDDSQSSREY